MWWRGTSLSLVYDRLLLDDILVGSCGCSQSTTEENKKVVQRPTGCNARANIIGEQPASWREWSLEAPRARMHCLVLSTGR